MAYGVLPPTPTPAPVKRTVSGTDTQSKRVSLPWDVYDVHVQWLKNKTRFDNPGHIAIWFTNVVGRCYLLVNEIAESGSETHFCTLGGDDLRIQVDAESGAEWSITFGQD